MENAVSLSVLAEPCNLTEQSGKNRLVVIEQKPDRFEPKITVTGAAAATVGAVGTGTGVYKISKSCIGKAMDWVEKEYNSLLAEKGKQLSEIPKNIKVNCKYIGAAAAGIGAAALFFKDSDKDGKLDIIEAAQKFITPGE